MVELMTVTTPVSYTHLDVYKRQRIWSILRRVNNNPKITEEILLHVYEEIL